MRLPSNPPDKYDKAWMESLLRAISEADAENVKLRREIDLLRAVLTSSGGVRWKLTVTDGGTVGTEAV